MLFRSNMTEMSKASPALFMALGAQLYSRLSLANRGVGPIFTTVVTNVPGPPIPIYSAGAKMQSMMGLLCLTDGMGLGHVVQSYTDEATIAFTADREMMPDPEFYVECIRQSYEELRDAAKAGGEPAAKKSTPKKPAAKKRAPARKAATTTKKAPAKKGTKRVASRSQAAPKGKGTTKT